MNRETFIALSGERTATTAALWLRQGTDAAEFSGRLRDAIARSGDYDVAIPGEIRKRSLALFDRTFAVTYLLEAVAVLIGLFGISASTSSQVLARRGEFGMLRHLGVTRREIGRMLAFEGAALGAIGVAAGLVVGAIVSMILIFVVNRQSFHWTMDVHVPWGLLAILSVVLDRCGCGDGGCQRTSRDGRGRGPRGEGGLVKARRLAAGVFALLIALRALGEVAYPPVVPGHELAFPRDEGSHPDYRIEWWYVTGQFEDGAQQGQGAARLPGHVLSRAHGARGRQPEQLRAAAGAVRACRDRRPGQRQAPSRAAQRTDGIRPGVCTRGPTGREAGRLVDPAGGARQVRHGSVMARTSTSNSRSHRRSRRCCRVSAASAARGRTCAAASYYYSLPQLAVTGAATADGSTRKISGRAWFDHEWSSDYVDRSALGWDWLGVNMADGGALMAFRMRDRQGGARWASATLRLPSPAGEGEVTTFGPEAVRWTPLQSWRSPRTGVTYPVQWRVQVGDRRYRVEPLAARRRTRFTTDDRDPVLGRPDPARRRGDGQGSRSRLPRTDGVRRQGGFVKSLRAAAS